MDINPFCYRGYYYDTETGFYYLQTRYYDPEAMRFINLIVFVIGVNYGIKVQKWHGKQTTSGSAL